MHIEPKLFLEESISEETKALNKDILEKISALPDPWSFPPSLIRQLRREGKGPFPLAPKLSHAQTRTIKTIPVRIIAPQKRESTGLYLHCHGGGWMYGQSDFQDPRLERIAENTGLITISIEYRLCPEHPFPAAPDDCEAIALWAVSEGKKEFGVETIFMGGESAGAHLTAVTAIRLRDRHQLTPFAGLNLVCGSFDLSLTPSARNWGDARLVLNTRDIENYVKNFIPATHDPRSPDISPLYAKLENLAPALFSVGTSDPLVDDTLFMAQRWQAAGNETHLKIYAGGCHAFEFFDSNLTNQSLSAMDDFLNSKIA